MIEILHDFIYKNIPNLYMNYGNMKYINIDHKKNIYIYIHHVMLDLYHELKFLSCDTLGLEVSAAISRSRPLKGPLSDLQPPRSNPSPPRTCY